YLKDGEHRVALYMNDFNRKGRTQKVEVLDGRNDTVLVSRTVSNFEEGKYVVYDISGHVKIRLNAENTDSAVYNGIFFGKNACNALFNTGCPADIRNSKPLRDQVASKFVGFWPQSVMGWDPPMSTATIQALDDFLEKARVDKDRVYCTGLSMGGRGTWVFAEEAAPRLAAIVPMDAFGHKPEIAQKTLKDCNIWIIVGAQDG